MSGIVGIYYPHQQQVNPQQLAIMINTQSHRGPDGSQVWCKTNIGLGHGMLWTTPESLNEKLPFTDGTDKLTITADARIDNRAELIPLLDLEETEKDKIADSTIILAAYQKWGENCLDKLLGDFAFAIWDENKQQLFCARDHFGLKPFYYYYQPEVGFIMASEIKAIIALPQIPVEINEIRIGDCLTRAMSDREITIYQNIRRLPPAHTLIVNSDNKLLLKPYWQLELKPKIKLNSDREYAEKFCEIFTEAVRCRLRSAYPVGSDLSGGLDSSSVTCVARDILLKEESTLHTFSNIFDSVPETNERKYIETVVAKGGVIPHFVYADKSGPLTEWSEFYSFREDPTIGNGYFVWGLNRAAAKAKVRIVLNGFDGDSTVSHGTFRLTELAQAQEWNKFLQEGTAVAQNFGYNSSRMLAIYGKNALKEFARQGKWLALINGIRQISPKINTTPQKLLIDCLLKPLVPEFVKQGWRKIRYGKSYTNEGTENLAMINPEFAQRINLPERLKSIEQKKDFSISEQEEHLSRLTSGSLLMAIEAMDVFTAAFSIERRCPFMDKRLIEYCLALPVEQKLDRGWSRMVLRRAMENILPVEIQWRGDKSISTPAMIKTLIKYDSELLDQAILSEVEQFSDYVRSEQIIKLWEDSKATGKFNGNLIEKLWPYLSLALWQKKKNIKAKSPD
ncbi:MAG: lasso peptide isopeptide bond-forming cyclase [Cyanobacteria bacterium J06648_1]